ncbi:MAG: hypothetical protein R3C29_03950 [Dehalococcoidia bacterium]
MDVNVDADLQLYVDPHALRLYDTEWGRECVHLVQNFFATVLDAVRAGDETRGLNLLGQLREPNETRLGMSQHRPRGRGLGPNSAVAVWAAFCNSEAARTGLLDDLEDTLLMIEGIGKDIVSDITTNVIREPLIRYTQTACELYGIPLVEDVASGALWNPATEGWTQGFVRLPKVGDSKLLLIPKAIVRVFMDYDVAEYYRHHVLTYLADQEIRSESSLMHLLRDGSPRVYKTELIERYGSGKTAAIEITLQHPEILDGYRSHKREIPSPPLTHGQIAEVFGDQSPDWDRMLERVVQIPPGNEFATEYHRAVQELLTALFYPWLANPIKESEIHEGRKRIDILYSNLARTGFFHWLGLHYGCPTVPVECKNYAADPQNEALDQLSGRFGHARGWVGVLACRTIEDKERMVRRCRDTALDKRGFILALDDEDLKTLVELRKESDDAMLSELRRRFDRLT